MAIRFAVSTLILFFIWGSIAEVTAQNKQEPLLKKVDAEALNEIITSYEGKKAVLINVWATWCIPCVEEFPEIVKIQKKYPEKLQVIFVSVDFPKQRNRVISFLKKHHVTWTTYLSTSQSPAFISSLSDEWSGTVPFTKILNKSGKVVASWENKADFDTFNKHVKRALNR